MSGKRAFKAQASSSKAVFGGGDGFGVATSFGAVNSSILSYAYEPPDLSAITDPAIVVAFKNLQKKDSTTKSKALEELEAFVLSAQDGSNGVEDAVLETWSSLYPRTSIDTSRRVRQLAHVVQGHLAAACGRRVAKHMPAVAGAWLSGTFDNDRAVARSARESFAKVFATPEKQDGVWKTFHRPTLEYCRNALLNETSRTLSDERTVSPDDAEAKYARTAGTALLTVVYAMGNLPKDIIKDEESLAKIIQAETAWRLSSSPDSFLRRAVFRFLSASLDHLDQHIGVRSIRKCFLQEALLADQHGSMDYFLQALTRLTETHPDSWGSPNSSSAKKSPVKNLYRFLKRGSQGASAEIWSKISKLLQLIPLPLLQLNSDGAEIEKPESDEQHIPRVLAALHEGITRKDELMANQDEALACYLDTVQHLKPTFPDPQAAQSFYQDAVLPLVSGLLRLSKQSSKWPVKTKQWDTVIVRAIYMSLPESQDVLSTTLKNYSEFLIEGIRMSQPVQSKNYTQSQDSLIQTITRWYEMQKAVLASREGAEFRSLFVEMNIFEVRASIDLLKAREGKPYSAAALLAIATQKLPDTTVGETSTQHDLQQFVREAVPSLMASPSAPYLLNLLPSLGWSDETREVYAGGLDSLVSLPESSLKSRILVDLVTSPWPSDSSISSALFRAVENEPDDSANGAGGRWNLLGLAVRNETLPEALAFQLLSRMTEGLSLMSDAAQILRMLDSALKENIPAFKSFIASSESSKMISLTISFSQTIIDGDSEVSEIEIKSAAESLMSNPIFISHTSESMINAVQNEVRSASGLSVPIDSVVSQARRLLGDERAPDLRKTASALVPGDDELRMVLRPYLYMALDPSLSMTNALGGLLYLIDMDAGDKDPAPDTIASDPEGRSITYRVAFFVVKVIEETDVFKLVSEEHRAAIFHFLTVFNQIASDHLGIEPHTPIWGKPVLQLDGEVVDFIAEAQALAAKWITWLANGEVRFLNVALNTMKSESGGSTVSAYYNARAYAYVMSEVRARHGIPQSIKLELEFLFASMNITAEPKLSLQKCNELISNLTDLEEDTLTYQHKKTLKDLVMLNTLLENNDTLLQQVPQRRRVMLMQSLVTAFEEAQPAQPIVSEALKIMVALISGLIEIYGEFWEGLLDIINRYLRSEDSNLPTLHASLRAYLTIRLSVQAGAAEDLQEAFADKQKALIGSLFGLVQRQSAVPDSGHQPRRMVNDLLARQITASEDSMPADVDNVYPIMASEAFCLQRAAFRILHRNIPAAQEQISIDAVLSKDKVVTLPEALLSLISEKPDAAGFEDLKTEPEMPPSLARYLLCWKLVFDHWTNASYKVQGDYVACMKEKSYLTGLLNFIFQLLIAPRGPHQIINPSKFGIESYLPDRAENPEVDAQYLLTHLYYLALKHLPHLTKAWWRSDCPRPLEKPVEDWTEKHISPLVVRAELDAVAAWDPNPEAAPSDPALEVKVAPRAREVVASYPVDETSMAIRVTLPTAYPLQPVTFTTVRRVAVDDKRWGAWLNTSQIVANFASMSQGLGCVVDGLVVWRRNVVGAMKEQSECAICYSVVSPDKMLPTKRCGTCKNVFHGHCLFRWFKSSSTSGCPLCRNPFHYG